MLDSTATDDGLDSSSPVLSPAAYPAATMDSEEEYVTMQSTDEEMEDFESGFDGTSFVLFCSFSLWRMGGTDE